MGAFVEEEALVPASPASLRPRAPRWPPFHVVPAVRSHQPSWLHDALLPSLPPSLSPPPLFPLHHPSLPHCITPLFPSLSSLSPSTTPTCCLSGSVQEHSEGGWGGTGTVNVYGALSDSIGQVRSPFASCKPPPGTSPTSSLLALLLPGSSHPPCKIRYHARSHRL